MCGEDFEEYFDEDSDKWKLRDCVKIRAQVRRRKEEGGGDGRMMLMGIHYRCVMRTAFPIFLFLNNRLWR